MAPKGGPATGRETVFPSIGPAELAVDGPNREEATPGPFFSFLKYTGMNRDMPLSPGDTFGPHQLIAPIGKGVMGEVYHAKDTKLDRAVAIKVLPEEYAQDADRAAAASLALQQG